MHRFAERGDDGDLRVTHLKREQEHYKYDDDNDANENGYDISIFHD